jgi:hypothetical protein
MSKTTQLALDNFNLKFVKQLSQVLAGEAQFFSQTEGRGAGNLAIRGRRFDPGFYVFGHGYLITNIVYKKYLNNEEKSRG